MVKRIVAASAVVALAGVPVLACLVNGQNVGCDTPFIGCHADRGSWTGGEIERPSPIRVANDEEPAPDTVVVHVFNNEYSINPEGLDVIDPIVTPGTTVRWEWDRGVHDVTSLNGGAEYIVSATSFPPFLFEYTFMNPGVFTYYCTVHGQDNQDGTATGMVGTITVVPEAGTIGVAGAALAALRRRRR